MPGQTTNETLAPWQFDSTVNVGAVNVSSFVTNPSGSPSGVNLQAWSFPTYLASGTGSAVTAAGRLYLAALNLTAGITLSKLYFSIATAASGITSSQNFAMLFSPAGAQVAVTSDLSTAIGTNTGFISGSLTSAYTVPTSGLYTFGIYFNAGTTLPVLTCMVNAVTVTTSATTVAGPNSPAAATYPFSVSATSGLTTTPPATITLSSNSLTNAYVFWCGAS